MIHLISITYQPPSASQRALFPFNLPVIESLSDLRFTSPVTFFVGENGSGKSTLLEAIACAGRIITAGSDEAERDATLSAGRALADRFRLTWEKRTHKGFFLRAEDFFGYVKRLAQMRADMERDLKTIDDEYAGRSETAKGLAKMPYTRELGELQRRYGEGLDAQSHGESFLKFFQARFVPGGLYLLDEPEAPLSPGRQLALIAVLKQMVAEEAQFIIATHSPILLAFPSASILNFDANPLERVSYEDLEHVRLTRDFLNNPALYLKHL